jgi:hypothetical protein
MQTTKEQKAKYIVAMYYSTICILQQCQILKLTGFFVSVWIYLSS